MQVSPVLYCTLIVSLGGFIFGFDASVISGTLSFISNEFRLSAIEQGFVVGAPTLGAIIATLTGGVICDAIGRKNLLIVIAFFYLISAIASALATDYWMLVSARFIGGMAFCSLMIAPMYIAEISPSDKRGFMVSVNQLNIMVGFSVAYFSNFYLLQWSQSASEFVQRFSLETDIWRWMLGLEVLPALIWFIALFFVPRSPRWLLLKNREKEAVAALARLNGCGSADISVEPQLREIKATLTEKVEPLLERLKQTFGLKMRFALFIGLIVGIAQQITGINAVYFYAPTIFEQSGVGTNAAFAQAIWIGIINVVFTVIAMLLIDKLGRKPLLSIGLVGVVVSMLLCSWGFSQATYRLDPSDITFLAEEMEVVPLASLTDVQFDSDTEFKTAVSEKIGGIVFNQHQGTILQRATHINSGVILIGILGFVASFAFSLGPVMWVLFSEIFPNQVRGIAVSFVGVVNSIVSFKVQLMFPWELEVIGAAATFAIYGGFALIGLLLVIRYFPETKGKSLEEIEAQLISVRATTKTTEAGISA